MLIMAAARRCERFASDSANRFGFALHNSLNLLESSKTVTQIERFIARIGCFIPHNAGDS
jgi:hypothetical protein